jgi:hypothetical protein
MRSWTCSLPARSGWFGRTAPTTWKIEGLRDDAFRLYVAGLVWCCAHETDGFVGRRTLHLLHPTAEDLPNLAARLVTAGLWETAEGGWMVHDFLEYQTSRADRDAERAAARERKRKQRATTKLPGEKNSRRGQLDGHSVAPAGGHSVTRGEGHGGTGSSGVEEKPRRTAGQRDIDQGHSVTKPGGHAVTPPDVGKARARQEQGLQEGASSLPLLLPMRKGESDSDYERRFGRWEAARGGGDVNESDREFYEQAGAEARSAAS